MSTHLTKFIRASLVTSSVVGLALAGVEPSAQAATANASLALSPTTKTVVHGGTVTLSVTMNTGGQAVNTAQIYLAFPDSRLDCSSITPAAAMPSVAAKTCNSNTAAIAVYVPAGTAPVNGTLKVATITLKTTSLKGTASVSFDRTRSYVVEATSNVDILATTNTAVIKVT